ncbi:MAG: hypothetical protein K2M11_08690 [Paramuribaculum sp.]|nr:hypothetical protein [Paramuribaculum sp.]
MRRFILSTLALVIAVSAAFAITPFRKHRFDQFKALPLQDSAIVFFGNSITNMHEWWEAFGSEQKVLNRGNSGALTFELVDNVGTVIALQPAKVFIGIGTNDLGSRAYNQTDSVAFRIGEIVRLIKEGSPATEVYVTSILPSNNGIRTLDSIQATNSKVKEIIEPQGATYIDLFDDLMGIPTHEISYDGLHVTSKGYAIWLDKIAPMVGLESIYTPEMVENNGGIPNNSFGMRNTYFSAYPIKSTDIIIMGDEMIHGGEWHELLANPNVKNRGTGWGYGGLSLGALSNATEAIFAANGNKVAPEKILLYAGTAPLYSKNNDMEATFADYKALIEKIREYAPASDTRIEIMSLIPRNSSELNDSLTVPFNNLLKTLVSEEGNIGFIDIYTPLVQEDNSAKPEYVEDEFLTGRGYGEVARTIAPFIPGSKARCPKCIEDTYNKIAASTNK